MIYVTIEWLHRPRGLTGEVEDLFASLDSTIEIIEDRPEPPATAFEFRGTLRLQQSAAVADLIAPTTPSPNRCCGTRTGPRQTSSSTWSEPGASAPTLHPVQKTTARAHRWTPQSPSTCWTTTPRDPPRWIRRRSPWSPA